MSKKITAVVLTLAVALTIVGCGTSKTDYGNVKLAKYKGVTVYKDDVKVTDAMYKQAVDNILQQSSTSKTVKKGTVKKDSTVVTDYSGKIEVGGKKVKFEGGTANDQTIDITAQASSFIAGFTDALVGHKVGDKFTKKLKFPKSYGQSTKINKKDVKLAGKDVWFTFKIKSIQKTVTPKLDDKFVAEQYGVVGVKTVKEFKKYAKKQMLNANITNKVWQKIIDASKVKNYNAKALKKQKKEQESQFVNQLQQQYGADLKTYLEACSMSQKDWDKQLDKQSKTTLKEKMVVYAIAEEQDLIPSGSEYKKEAETLAKQNKSSVKEIESQYGKEQVEYAIIYQNVQEFIAENVTYKKGSEPTTTMAPVTTAKAKATKAAKATKKSK